MRRVAGSRSLVSACMVLGSFFLFAGTGTAPSAGATITYNFNDGTFGGLVNASDAGFAASVTGGSALLSQTAGANNGAARLETPFVISGDFEATVTATRSALGSAEMGMEFFGSAADSDIFFVRSNEMEANIFTSGTANLILATSAVLEIARTGNTITESYDIGAGFVNLASSTDPNLSGNGKIRLFLRQGFGSTSANSGTFDNLTITSDSISAVPLPSAAYAGFAIIGALGLTGVVRRTRCSQA